MLTAFTILGSVLAWFKANETILFILVSILLGFEQWIAKTPRFKANSTMQLIANFIDGAVKIIGFAYKLSSGKVLMIDGSTAIVVPAQPAPPTPAEVMQKAIESPATVLEVGQAAAFQQVFDRGKASIQNQLES